MTRIGVASGPIEREGADVAIVPLFEAERPLRDTAGRIDWRLCGRLSHLFAQGRLWGRPGEAVLLPGGGGVRAPLVLGLGLGSRREVQEGPTVPSPWAAWVRDALARSQGLAARRVALGLPDFGPTLAERLSELASEAARSAASLELTLAFAPDDRSEAVEWLRRAAQRSLPSGLEIRHPKEARAPQGGATSNPPTGSSRGSAGRFTR